MPETFLELLEPADRDAVVATTRNRVLSAGQVLFRHGEPGTTFAIVLSGRVKIVRSARSGRSVLVGLRGPGDLVGEQAVLDGERRGADVVAVEECAVLVGAGDALRKLLDERPAMLLVLCGTLSARLRESDEGRVEMAALTGNARVAVRLLQLGGRYGRVAANGVRIDLPITQDELADWTGLSRPAVARALAELRDGGHVLTGRRMLTLVDPQRLRTYLDRLE